MDVTHDIDHSRFIIETDGHVAELQYKRVGGDVLDLQHTQVPPELGHRGFGDALARAAFDYARANGLRLIITCPFVRHWLVSHPAERDLVIPSSADAQR